jgi:hypothetical protein
MKDAGVIDQDVHRTQEFQGLAGKEIHLPGVAQVGGVGRHAGRGVEGGEFTGGGLDGGLLARGEHGVPSLADETGGDGLADAPAGACDDNVHDPMVMAWSHFPGPL